MHAITIAVLLLYLLRTAIQIIMVLKHITSRYPLRHWDLPCAIASKYAKTVKFCYFNGNFTGFIQLQYAGSLKTELML